MSEISSNVSAQLVGNRRCEYEKEFVKPVQNAEKNICPYYVP